jgi:hypothetical protein
MSEHTIPNGYTVYDWISHSHYDSASVHRHLRRIVACVNACAGLSTEALESGALQDVLEKAWCDQSGLRDLRKALTKLEGK